MNFALATGGFKKVFKFQKKCIDSIVTRISCSYQTWFSIQCPHSRSSNLVKVKILICEIALYSVTASVGYIKKSKSLMKPTFV
jgi:hypothetical protein